MGGPRPILTRSEMPAELLPRPGDHLFTCLHPAELWYWSALEPPQELTRSDGSKFLLRYIRMCQDCWARNQQGEQIRTKERIVCDHGIAYPDICQQCQKQVR
jgi:hypothetical protein